MKIFFEDIYQELKQEAAVTRNFLALVPFEKANFKPHVNSEELGRLAIHLAELQLWWQSCLTSNEMNFVDFEPENIKTTKQLLVYFDRLLEKTLQLISRTKLELLEENWTMKYGEEVLFTSTKKEILRKFCMNHMIHHRAQLGVYLRLLNIPLPATYGPSAEDDEVTLVEGF